jgi:hypothetical protein
VSIRDLFTYIPTTSVHTVGDAVALTDAERAFLTLGDKYALDLPRTLSLSATTRTAAAEARRVSRLIRLHLYFHANTKVPPLAVEELRYQRRLHVASGFNPDWSEVMNADHWHRAHEGQLADVATAVVDSRARILRCLDVNDEDNQRIAAASRQRCTNLSRLQRAGMHRLLRRGSELVVRPSDKGLGPSAMTVDWYKQQVRQHHLGDATAYFPDHRPHRTILRAVFVGSRTLAGAVAGAVGSAAIDRWVSAYYPPDPEDDDDFVPGNYHVARMYLLPKVHKTPVASRPIVASHSYVTTPLSKVIAEILQPVVERNCPWLVRDTSDLLNRVEQLHLPADVKLFSADVVSLYPNMPHDVTVNAVRYFMAQDGATDAVIDTVVAATRHVLENNYITEPYTDMTVRQTLGTAMGTPVAPQLANIFMAYVELKGLHGAHTPISAGGPFLYYFRFMDDLHGAVPGGTNTNDIETLIAYNADVPNTIRLTWEWSDTQAAFLDATLYKGPRFQSTGVLDTRLYRKPAQQFAYVPYHSNHPRACLSGFIKSETQRIVRLCTNVADFERERQLFFTKLRRRGYPRDFIRTAFHSVSHADRAALLAAAAAAARAPPPDDLLLAFRTENNLLTRDLRLGAHVHRCLSRVLDQLRALTGNNITAVIAWRLQQTLRRRLTPLTRPP